MTLVVPQAEFEVLQALASWATSAGSDGFTLTSAEPLAFSAHLLDHVAEDLISKDAVQLFHVLSEGLVKWQADGAQPEWSDGPR